jgi:hypothetical protein
LIWQPVSEVEVASFAAAVEGEHVDTIASGFSAASSRAAART